jgi:GNAT superfamily N-acetyltransferase
VSAVPDILVRLACEADDSAVGELLVDAFVQTYARKMPEVVVTAERKAQLRAVAAKRAVAHVLVAEVEGMLAGTVAVWAPGTAGSEAWRPNAADLRHLAVSLRHRQLGISTRLLDAAEAQAWHWGADAVCLHVRRGAHGVRRLYTARGYLPDPAGDLERPEVSLEALALERPR